MAQTHTHSHRKNPNLVTRGQCLQTCRRASGSLTERTSDTHWGRTHAHVRFPAGDATGGARRHRRCDATRPELCPGAPPTARRAAGRVPVLSPRPAQPTPSPAHPRIASFGPSHFLSRFTKGPIKRRKPLPLSFTSPSTFSQPFLPPTSGQASQSAALPLPLLSSPSPSLPPPKKLNPGPVLTQTHPHSPSTRLRGSSSHTASHSYSLAQPHPHGYCLLGHQTPSGWNKLYYYFFAH